MRGNTHCAYHCVRKVSGSFGHIMFRTLCNLARTRDKPMTVACMNERLAFVGIMHVEVRDSMKPAAERIIDGWKDDGQII